MFGDSRTIAGVDYDEDIFEAFDKDYEEEDDADDVFGDIDFLDHCVQDVFEDYTD